MLIIAVILFFASGLATICVMLVIPRVAAEQDHQFYDLADVDGMKTNETNVFKYYRAKEKVTIKSDYKEVVVFVGPKNHTTGKLDFFSSLNKEFQVGAQIRLQGKVQPRSSG